MAEVAALIKISEGGTGAPSCPTGRGSGRCTHGLRAHNANNVARAEWESAAHHLEIVDCAMEHLALS
jgi:hypothetical protein